MKYFEDVKNEQEKIIQELREKTIHLIERRIKPINEIYACLLSGSVSRGDYYPGKYDGAIDLTVFVEDKKKFKISNFLGESESEIEIFHMLEDEGQFYQIKIYDTDYFKNYKENDEVGKYALFESRIIFDENDKIRNRLTSLKENVIEEEIRELFLKKLGYAKYLINEYKVERWKKRNAVIQLIQNLNRAIELSISCLFNINGFYAPAEDRALYYSFALSDLPNNYVELMDKLLKVEIIDFKDHENREELFKEELMAYLEKRENIDLKHKYY